MRLILLKMWCLIEYYNELKTKTEFGISIALTKITSTSVYYSNRFDDAKVTFVYISILNIVCHIVFVLLNRKSKAYFDLIGDCAVFRRHRFLNQFSNKYVHYIYLCEY